MAGKDYGPRGCCGPTAYGVLLLVIGGFAALMAVIS